MTAKTDPVAKARIVLLAEEGAVALLSRKRADGKPKHGKLEMLGGHLEPDESPLQALIRELREEEATGALAEIVERRAPGFLTAIVDEAPHHLFEIRLAAADCAGLIHDPTESLGFEQVPLAELAAGEHQDELTWRTRAIFEAFGHTPP